MPPVSSSAATAGGGNSHAVSVHWFRHGLRLHDNPALLESLSSQGDFYPVFIFDGEVAGTKSAGYNRMRFLLECLTDIDESLKKVGGRLYVFHGQPVTVLEKIFQEWGVTQLTFEQDPEPVWQERDDAVKQLCADRGVKCIERISHTLWDPRQIIKNNGGSPPLTYMLFNQVATMTGDPPSPVEDPDFSKVKLHVSGGHDEYHQVPTLEHLGVDIDCPEQVDRKIFWKGGETKALELLTARLISEEKAFDSGHVMPNQTFPDLTRESLSLSPYLRFGCLSIRKLYWGIREAYEKKKRERQFNISAVGQLLWREYFYTLSVNNNNFNTMESNPICLNIPWYSDTETLDKWTKGETGYPWIDAIMKQLRYEGWVHHVARHAVSTFLTRGDLWLSWEDGLKVFDKYLLDADWSVCAGNWMWMSSSAFEKVLQCPKCFCPVRYGRKMDPTGEYIRKYLPVLKDMPLRYLFEPWLAPKAVQEKAGCIVGVDYPNRIVDHQKASKHCYKLMLEVKQKLIEAGKEFYPHCAPANREEVASFCWLPISHPGDGEGKTNFDILCDGLQGL